MSKRLALIVNNSRYQDRNLARLKTPEVDLHALASSLIDPEIGNFDRVETAIDQPAAEIRRQIAELLHAKKRNDLLLLYFLGLGLQDEAGRLYLAAVDTAPAFLEETAIPAAYVTACIDRSFSRQKVLILDCYYGLVAGRKAGNQVDASVGTASAFKGKGHGRVVLTAADSGQFILRGDDLIDRVEESLFSHHLIGGLQTGAADLDRDGQIGIRELFDYIYDQIIKQPLTQKPRKWTYQEQDKFIIARNPNKAQRQHRIKWDLIFGAIMAPITTILIGLGAWGRHIRLWIYERKLSPMGIQGGCCEGFSDTWRGEVLAVLGNDRQVSEKPQGRKPRGD